MEETVYSGHRRARSALSINRNPILQNEAYSNGYRRVRKPSPELEKRNFRTESLAQSTYSEKHRKSFSFSHLPAEPEKTLRKIVRREPSQLVRGSRLRKSREFAESPVNPLTLQYERGEEIRVRTKITESSIDLGCDSWVAEEAKSRTGLFENMRSRVFCDSLVGPKRLLKNAPTRPSELANIIMYTECKFKEQKISVSPNRNRIRKEDLEQKRILCGLAKSYGDRMHRSQIVIN